MQKPAKSQFNVFEALLKNIRISIFYSYVDKTGYFQCIYLNIRTLSNLSLSLKKKSLDSAIVSVPIYIK